MRARRRPCRLHRILHLPCVTDFAVRFPIINAYLTIFWYNCPSKNFKSWKVVTLSVVFACFFLSSLSLCPPHRQERESTCLCNSPSHYLLPYTTSVGLVSICRHKFWISKKETSLYNIEYSSIIRTRRGESEGTYTYRNEQNHERKLRAEIEKKTKERQWQNRSWIIIPKQHDV